MSDSKRPGFDGVAPLGPLPTMRPPANDDDAPRTDPGLPVSAGYVKAKLEEVRVESEKRTWLAGWVAGIGSSLLMITLAFTVWFKADANAQEKADKAQAHAVEISDAGADKKLAPVITNMAVMQNDITNIKTKLETSDQKQDEIIRLIKARR